MNNDLEEDIEKAKNIEKKSLINVKNNNIKYLKKNHINLIILLKIATFKKNYIKHLIFLLLLSYFISERIYIFSR